MTSKKYLFLSILSFFTLSFSMAQPVKVHGHLKVVGTQLTDEHNQAVVLRGMSFGWHCFHPRFYNAGTVHWLHQDWKCNVVRAAIGAEPHGGYIEDSATAMAKLRAVINGAINEGIYVIVDWHSHHINQKEADVFFKTVAKEYGKYPNIIYELFNEPNYEPWDSVKNYEQEVISIIRSIDPDNVILAGNPHWDQDINLPASDPIKNVKNLMYTLHFYAGTHKQWLRDRADSALQKGIPVFISESAGMEASGDGAIDDKEWKAWIEWAEKRKLSWITWSVSDKNETCSVLQTSAASDGNWKESDLKESGIKTRALLRTYNAAIK